jgi:hypothetical protein
MNLIPLAAAELTGVNNLSLLRGFLLPSHKSKEHWVSSRVRSLGGYEQAHMQYRMDISNLCLSDLIDLEQAVRMGILEISTEHRDVLSSYVRERHRTVLELERLLHDQNADSPEASDFQ